ncbi:hypothetical protein V8Z80_09900 [Orrella sp. JC864]
MIESAFPRETVAAQAERMHRELLHELKYRIARPSRPAPTTG